MKGRYSTKTYQHAIWYACDRAGVPSWHPNQLRHNAATLIRKLDGIEVARIILSHSNLTTTEVYAEADMTRVVKVVAEVG